MDIMQIWGHRGAFHHAPENTLLSFEKAIALGADGIELDVQLTKDAEVVVIHDERIDRVSDGVGLVQDYTLAELKKMNFNKRKISEPHFLEIPTLDETLQLLKNTSLMINIELKTGIVYYKDIERKTLDIVKQHKMSEYVLYSSFNHYTIQKLKELDATAKTALLCGGGTLTTAEQCEKVGASALHPSVQQMRYPGLVEDCHKRGVKVHVWVVDRDEDFEYAKQHGVDGIFVNDLMRFKK